MMNAFVMYNCLRDVRAIAAGSILSITYIDKLLAEVKDGKKWHPSELCRLQIFRVCGIAVVLRQAFHPTLTLMLKQIILRIGKPVNSKILDDWNEFLNDIKLLTVDEQRLVLQVFVVGASFSFFARKEIER